MKTPFFSIIIPTLNEEKYLPHLLDDLAHQTFLDFEVIVVDGNSQDQTCQLIQKYLPLLPSLIVLSSAKRHVCVQRNLGAKKAKSPYLVFLDADTRLPSFFLSGIKYRLESSGADIVTTRFKPDKTTSINIAVANTINLFLEIQNNYKPTYLLEAMIVIKKTCFENIGGFNQSTNYAEGGPLIQAATKKGFRSQYFHDPIWTYSFRRFRKFGFMGIAARTVKIEIIELLGLDSKHDKIASLYPMEGGKFFDEPERIKLFLKLKNRLNTAHARQKFLFNLAKIISYLES